jgi:initiation factor 1A
MAKSKKDLPIKSGLRTAEVGEQYAIVLKILGNGNVQLKLLNGTETIGKIRKKFKRKNKDVINVGTWVLAGEREYETKKAVCDILEVYTTAEVNRLMETDGNWNAFTEDKIDYSEVVQFQENVNMDVNMNVDIDVDDI